MSRLPPNLAADNFMTAIPSRHRHGIWAAWHRSCLQSPLPNLAPTRPASRLEHCRPRLQHAHRLISRSSAA